MPQPDGGLDVNTYQNFAITDDAVIFVFGEGQVGEVGGPPLEVPVPRTNSQHCWPSAAISPDDHSTPTDTRILRPGKPR